MKKIANQGMEVGTQAIMKTGERFADIKSRRH